MVSCDFISIKYKKLEQLILHRELRACKQVSSLNLYKYGISCFVKIKKRVEALYLRLCRVVTFLMILYEKTDVQFHCNE